MASKLTSALFQNSKQAGKVIDELKSEGFTDEISVIATQWDDTEVKTQTDKSSGTTGGVTGALIGGLAGLLIGAGSIVLPGIGTLLVAGPFTALMGVTGAVTGGLVGFLIDAGIPEDKAKKYETAIKEGAVLVAVDTEFKDKTKVQEIFQKHDAQEIYTNN